MPDPKSEPNYVDLLKLERKGSYTWDEVARKRNALSSMVTSGTEDMKRRARSKIAIIDRAIDDLGRSGFLEKLAEMAGEAPAKAGARGGKDLERLKRVVDRSFTEVAVQEGKVGIAVRRAGCEMSDARALLEARGVVMLQDSPEPPGMLDEFRAKQIRTKLKKVGKRDLYDFLGKDPASPEDELLVAARQKSKEYLHSKSKHRNFGKELAGRCSSVFRNETERRKYDHALIDEKLGDFLELDGLFDKELDREEIRRLLDTAAKEGLGREVVIRYIWSWAGDKGVKVVWPKLRAARARAAGGAAAAHSGTGSAAARSGPAGRATATPHGAGGTGGSGTPAGPAGRRAPVGSGAGGGARGGSATGGSTPARTGADGRVISGFWTSLSRRGRRLIAAWAVVAFGLVALWPDPGGQPSGVSPPSGRTEQTDAPPSQPLSQSARQEQALGLGRERWRSVQARLAGEGFSPGAIDGVPGSATRAAIRRWQGSRGLPESGYLNGAQLATLETAGAEELAQEEGADAAAARPREDTVAPVWEAARAAAARAGGDLVARARDAARSAAAWQDSVARAREAARASAAREDSVALAVEAARAWQDSVARAREAAERAAAARAREDSVARAREAARALAARARDDSVARARAEAANVDEGRISSDFGELESELAVRYAEMTRRYLAHWKAVDWDTEDPSVAFQGNGSVDSEARQSNQSARGRLRQAGDRLRNSLLNAVSPSPSVERRMTPSIETAHREYQREVDQHHNRLAALIGKVPGKVSALLLDVDPPDARVYIDDAPYGTAREFAKEPGRLVPSGTFRVRLERPGYRTHEETVSTRPYERHFIRGDMQRGSSVTTSSRRNRMPNRDSAKGD